MSQRIPQGLREKHSLKQEAVALPLCKTRVITRAILSNDKNTIAQSTTTTTKPQIALHDNPPSPDEFLPVYSSQKALARR